MREFQVRRKSRELYGFDSHLFSLDGNVIFLDQKEARHFTHLFNLKSKTKVRPGQVYLLGLIDEILHYVCSVYAKENEPNVFFELLSFLKERLGESELRLLLEFFLEEFPPPSVYSGKERLHEYAERFGGAENLSAKVLEEILLLWLANMNPAFGFLKEVFDDESLRRETAYLRAVSEMRVFFRTKKPFGPKMQSLFDMLRSPAEEEPNSLEGQLRYILENWGYLLGHLKIRIKGGLDSAKEEEVFFVPHSGLFEISRFDAEKPEIPSREEKDWMRELVLIAKQTYVWMNQLSKIYKRPVGRLDEIPEEELVRLRDLGITGIWLIGVWKRSPASKRIKNLSGNLDAIASAYSIYDYEISEDLGGEEALLRLKEKAERYGIKLGCDMVPNHFGIYSRWMIEKPEWLIFREDNPYPWYTFSGENLSLNEDIEIYLEDHYYDRTDAAVVCKRVDRRTNRTIYVYHGNDGTGMPWNDTVQINYLIPEAREEMIKTILRIAREFPIIRFDAAMTLTKMHYQRLWFPEPGHGGAIPTRSEFGMSKEEFDMRMPKEFWKEVVEEVERECKDTLLIAEAFWLLENYFIRHLGMHRVYNSAFMIMLRDERNKEFRGMIKDILLTDPEILGRLLNFMNNPDERTAYDQFGDGEKYFGVCTVMCSLPGLPMFGHGQIENFKEKYGMEFARPYLDEKPDENFIERHRREISPLLKNRRLFSRTENFHLFDFHLKEGAIDEDVYVLFNSSDSQFALILFNNSAKRTKGFVDKSCKRLDQRSRKTVERKLADLLKVKREKGNFTLLRDIQRGREVVYENEELLDFGLEILLEPYDHFVFFEAETVKEGSFRVWKFISQKSKDLQLSSLKAYYEIIHNLIDLLDEDELKTIYLRREGKEKELIEKKMESFREILKMLFKTKGEPKLGREELTSQENSLFELLSSHFKGDVELFSDFRSMVIQRVLSSFQIFSLSENEESLFVSAMEEFSGTKTHMVKN